MHSRGVKDVVDLKGSNEMRSQFPSTCRGRSLVKSRPYVPVDRQGLEYSGSWPVSETVGRNAEGQNGPVSTHFCNMTQIVPDRGHHHFLLLEFNNGVGNPGKP